MRKNVVRHEGFASEADPQVRKFADGLHTRRAQPEARGLALHRLRLRDGPACAIAHRGIVNEVDDGRARFVGECLCRAIVGQACQMLPVTVKRRCG